MTITTEEAERRAAHLHKFWGMDDSIAAMIRSLAAERDAAMQWRAAIDDAHTKRLMPIEDNPADALQRLIEVEVNAERHRVPLNPDRWRGAINDALTGWMHPILEDEVPKDALRRLIQHEITAALDPAVSQSAADLVAAERDALRAENARLREALQSVLNACDKGRMVERGVGGMTIDAQISRSFYYGVPAWPIEEARAALGET